eukprot:2170188-Rhodomonas_salina.1
MLARTTAKGWKECQCLLLFWADCGRYKTGLLEGYASATSLGTTQWVCGSARTEITAVALWTTKTLQQTCSVTTAALALYVRISPNCTAFCTARQSKYKIIHCNSLDQYKSVARPG